MPKVRRKHRPDRAKAHLTSFLETNCFVCLDSPHEHPSQPLLCCRKYIHEECLLECLHFANQAVGDSRPHCRAPIQAYHVSSPNVPLGLNPFCFRRVHYPPSRHRHLIRMNGSRILASLLSGMMIPFPGTFFLPPRLVGQNICASFNYIYPLGNVTLHG